MTRRATKITRVPASAMTLLPPAPHCCQVCAVEHTQPEPHNPESLYWQTARNMAGLPPATWADALAHVKGRLRRAWIVALNDAGVDLRESDVPALLTRARVDALFVLADAGVGTTVSSGKFSSMRRRIDLDLAGVRAEVNTTAALAISKDRPRLAEMTLRPYAAASGYLFEITPLGLERARSYGWTPAP